VITTLLIIHGLMAVAAIGCADPSNAQCVVSGRRADCSSTTFAPSLALRTPTRLSSFF
jgi:hypothetical protein